jgi:glycosidase
MVTVSILAGSTIAAGDTCASSLRIIPENGVPAVEADYTTSHLFLDEAAHQTAPITVLFDPQLGSSQAIANAEVFTNLNRRDKANADPDGRGVPEGIVPPPGNLIPVGDDRHYYKAYEMEAVPGGGFRLTLTVSQCGAFRLTARYRLASDPAGVYRWYGDERNAQGIPKRDHVIVSSPARLRDLRMYEVNPLTITATGSAPTQRGTLAQLDRATPVAGGPRFSLAYLRQLGINALWLQPIHPRGVAGRQIDPSTGAPFTLGSPYAVKNFFTVLPQLGSGSPSGDTEAGRAQALADFKRFMDVASANSLAIFLDVPFNHTAQDVELSKAGQDYWGNSSSSDRTEIRSIEARFFSRANAYDLRATGTNDIAVAPDRVDFGKFSDVFDIYFGRYAALVPNAAQANNYDSEGDWFDYSIGSENIAGPGNGHFDRITQNVWKFFGDYVQFWLTQSGYPENPGGQAINSSAGIAGLRADFAQGLPPQAWEYIINRTRSRKWDFIFMAESLDGGPVTYRSARHFDLLNDNLIYDLHHAVTADDFVQIYERRRNSYGTAPILLNTTSQDEDNYQDPFQAVLRFAVNSTMDGVPMIFPGQELGLSGTIVPPRDSDPSAGAPFGYERYDVDPVARKPIPQFKTYNSMMPLWQRLNQNNSQAIHLLALYSAIGQARSKSPALRSPNRAFLRPKQGVSNNRIFAVGKVETPNADPGTSDVVFAFVNLSLSSDVATQPTEQFNVNMADQDGKNLFGIRRDRVYNVKNIGAYRVSDAIRPERCLWGAGRSGEDILNSGIFVRLNKLPVADQDWDHAPYEPQYLKLVDAAANACQP